MAHCTGGAARGSFEIVLQRRSNWRPWLRNSNSELAEVASASIAAAITMSLIF